mgnify:CR=1 FL=1
MQQSTIGIGHQNFMLALRREMGWPTFKPANDCIAFCSGRRMDFEVGSELARIAQTLRKDAIYSSWDKMSATKPLGLSIAYRELLSVDIIDRLVPFAANDDAPVIFVSTRSDESFVLDGRGSLIRVAGKPKAIGAGRKLAMKRICATAATLQSELLADNQFVPFGSAWVEPEAPVETVVRFG